MLDATQLDNLAAGFTVLGRFHQAPPDAATLEGFWALLDEWPLAGTAGADEGLRLLRAAREAQEDATRIHADHSRLYGTFSAARVAPYESVHRGDEGLVFDEHTMAVRDAYRSLSLEAARLNRDPDDHIGLELEFIGQACVRALDALDHGSVSDAERYVRLGAEFLQDHLLQWAPQMLTNLVVAAETRFMKGLALLSVGALDSYARFSGVTVRQ